MNDVRPDQEGFLAHVKREEKVAGRGRLEVLAAASAAVRNIRAMLAPARSAREAGARVPARPGVVGSQEHAKSADRRKRYAATVLATVGATAVAGLLHGVFELSNIVMVFLLTVVLVAMRWGRGPAILAALLNVIAFDFFFVPPRWSFAVSDAQYLFTFGVMLAVGLLIGQLTAGLRYQARVSELREARTRTLYEFARDLSGLLTAGQVVETAEKFMARAFRAKVIVLAADAHDKIASAHAAALGDPVTLAAAQWAYDRAQPAGAGTDTLAGNEYLFLPLRAPMRTRGVLAIRPERPRELLVPEQMRQYETFAALAAIALERVHYVEVARDALIRMESERLRNSLLATLSHDLRTPLAAMLGLAETMALTQPPMSAQQSDIARMLAEETRRLIALVNNLLDMARIQSGEVKLDLQWHPMEEVVGSALRASAGALGGREVRVDIPADLPLVQMDAVLVERVLANLVENAAKYTPPESHIGVASRVAGTWLETRVEDDGPGIPAGKEEAIFEKFTRGRVEGTASGVGLGLAICRAIVEAHGGTIRAEAGRTRGAGFVFTLPLGTPPEVSGP
ncbi:MAG TPA: DUF4118 domain-containing protein [Usitatibacter sp.]|nr:DUF4118 domain-containing protein [Usitatibacter sp.]